MIAKVDHQERLKYDQHVVDDWCFVNRVQFDKEK